MTLSPLFFHQHGRGVQLALLLLVIFGVPIAVLAFPDYAYYIVWGVVAALVATLLWVTASAVTKFFAHPTPPPLAEQTAWQDHLSAALDQKYPGYKNLMDRYLTPAVLNFHSRQQQNAARELQRTIPLLEDAWSECRTLHTMGADPIYEAQTWLEEGDFFLTDDGIAFMGAYRDLFQASTETSSSS